MEKQTGIGLALGGGGARGFAHIGVIQAFEAANIPIVAIAGTSMGGLIGAAYAAGHSPQMIVDELHKLSKPRALTKLIDVKIPKNGLMPGKKFYQYLVERFGKTLTFADLPIPLTLIATDIYTGNEVLLNQGHVVDAMRATMSLPGVFVPIESGGLRLVDGGVVNNVPADVVQLMCNAPIIAVDVTPEFGSGEPIEMRNLEVTFASAASVSRSLRQTVYIMLKTMTRARLEKVQPDFVLKPEIPEHIGLFYGYLRYEEAIAAGERAATAIIPQLSAQLGM